MEIEITETELLNKTSEIKPRDTISLGERVAGSIHGFAKKKFTRTQVRQGSPPSKWSGHFTAKKTQKIAVKPF